MPPELGRIRPSARLVSPVTPRVSEAAFGAGIGQALSNMGASLSNLESSREDVADAQARVNAAYADRKRKLDRSSTQTALVRFNAELDREIVARQDQAPPNAAGFTDSVAEYAEEQKNAFLADVPEELRPEFSSAVENVKQQAINRAFDFQTQAENKNYRFEAEELATLAINQIMAGEATADAFIPQLDEFIANSPLTEQETLELRDTVEEAFLQAEFGQRASLEALQPDNAVGTFSDNEDGSDIVAAGMPGVARGFLNTTAGVESPGYNVMHGGKTFSDFSKHPNEAQLIKSGPNKGKFSTAAGRYQFIHSTWLEAKEALGLEDFSPESQDRAAWWLAQRDYKKKTGRDLELDLSSGDARVIASARRLLTSTWEGLGNLSDSAFVAGVTGAAPSPSSLMTEKRYDRLPFQEREKALFDARRQALANRTLLQREEAEQTEAAINSLKFQLLDKTAGLVDIDKLRDTRNLTFEQHQSLTSVYEKVYEDEIDLNEFVTKFNNPAYTFDPTSAEDKRGFDLAFQQKGPQAFAARDEDYVNASLLPSIQRAGFVPESAVTLLGQQMHSSDQRNAVFALDTMNKIRGLSTSAFKSFSEQQRADAVFFNIAQQYMPMDKVLAELNYRNDPELVTARKIAKEELSTVRKDHAEDFAVPGVLGAVLGDNDFPADPLTAAGLQADFLSLYEAEYPRYRDHEDTLDAVSELMKTTWGSTSLGREPVLMKHPPEASGYRMWAGGYSYMDTQVREALQLPSDADYRPLSDHITEAEIAAGVAPSYTIARKDQFGNYLPVMELQQRGDGSGDFFYTGKPARVFFEITPEMEQAQIEDTVWKTEIHELEQDIDALAAVLATNPNLNAVREEYFAKVEQLSQLEQNAPPIAAEERKNSLRGFIERHRKIKPTPEEAERIGRSLGIALGG